MDIDYSELSDELMEVCTVYNYEYWLNLFLDAMEDFDVEYVYYITPIGDDHTITYSLDIAPYEFEENGVTYRILGDLYPEPVEKHPMMWEAWESGKPSSGFDVFDNEFGHTYAYYAPLIIDGQKLGMVGAEVTVANVNHEILINTIRQLLVISIILLLSMGILLMVINRNYIRKIEHLSDNVKRYAENKDVEISGVIEHEAVGNDEICALANQTAAMILELDNYMKSIVETTRELTETKEHAQKMNELAKRDDLAPWEAVSASIGYALYDTDRDSSIDNVFKRADKAMYERKKKRFALFLRVASQLMNSCSLRSQFPIV